MLEALSPTRNEVDVGVIALAVITIAMQALVARDVAVRALGLPDATPWVPHTIFLATQFTRILRAQSVAFALPTFTDVIKNLLVPADLRIPIRILGPTIPESRLFLAFSPLLLGRLRRAGWEVGVRRQCVATGGSSLRRPPFVGVWRLLICVHATKTTSVLKTSRVFCAIDGNCLIAVAFFVTTVGHGGDCMVGCVRGPDAAHYAHYVVHSEAKTSTSVACVSASRVVVGRATTGSIGPSLPGRTRC
mmetsp:Transcript_132994/g.231189  ORF Transcript_132994/g.231189 Transcript_132994/m.231189 type:complete len:247 (+) Transcript_132994:890-1630(+)